MEVIPPNSEPPVPDRADNDPEGGATPVKSELTPPGARYAVVEVTAAVEDDAEMG